MPILTIFLKHRKGHDTKKYRDDRGVGLKADILLTVYKALYGWECQSQDHTKSKSLGDFCKVDNLAKLYFSNKSMLRQP